jgi:hypothetical protein
LPLEYCGIESLKDQSIKFVASLLYFVIRIDSFKDYVDPFGIILNMQTPGYGSVTLLLFFVLALSVGQKIVDGFLPSYGMRIHT